MASLKIANSTVGEQITVEQLIEKRILMRISRHDHVYTLQKKRHIRDILSRTNFFCHTYDTSMIIIVTKPSIIIDVVGSYFYNKKS